MAVFAGRTDVERTETVERRVVLGDGVFEEEFAVFEGVGHAAIFHGRGGVFEGRGRLVESGAELTACVGFFFNALGQRGFDGVVLATVEAGESHGQGNNGKGIDFVHSSDVLLFVAFD